MVAEALCAPVINRSNEHGWPVCPACGTDALESDLLDIGERSAAEYVMEGALLLLDLRLGRRRTGGSFGVL
jgi:hypothetical protein